VAGEALLVGTLQLVGQFCTVGGVGPPLVKRKEYPFNLDFCTGRKNPRRTTRRGRQDKKRRSLTQLRALASAFRKLLPPTRT